MIPCFDDFFVSSTAETTAEPETANESIGSGVDNAGVAVVDGGCV